MAFRFHFQYKMISPRKPTSYIFQTQPTLSMSYYYLYYNKYFSGKNFLVWDLSLPRFVDTIMFSICHFHVAVLLQQLSSLSFVEYFFLIILISFS